LYAQDGGSLDSWGLNVCYSTPCSMNASASATTTDCSNNGTATAVAIGGSGNYTYNWNNGQSTATATALGAGNYSVTITDSQGCTATAQVTVIQTGTIPSQPGAFTASNDTVCAGSTTNTFTVPFVVGVNYTWTYSGNGATITGTSSYSATIVTIVVAITNAIANHVVAVSCYHYVQQCCRC
jgi:hypothetical protein